MPDINYDELPYHPVSEALVKILQRKTQSENDGFFRLLVSYTFCKIASVMRTNIVTHDRGTIPVNMYAINLAPSGTGKGYSSNIIEENLISPFRDIFMETTYQIQSEARLKELAIARAVRTMQDEEVEFEIMVKEFESLGHLLFSFDSGTTPAVKQMRHKLLMAGSGALSMEIDEIGSNLLSNLEVLNTFLELYDVGKIKAKLIKNTAENKRLEEIDGKTPTNMLLFGTPTKVLDGSKTEDEFFSMLETGYARRCLFCYSKTAQHTSVTDAAELYDLLTDTDVIDELSTFKAKMEKLASEDHFGIELSMDKPTHLQLLQYKIDCGERARRLKDHQELQKAEMEHRYYKALKLAGAYAFMDESTALTIDHINHAIRLTEDSGKAFTQIVNREQAYARLAHYVADVAKPVTFVDLVENLPFFRGSEGIKRELMTMATAYGYKNNVIIKRTVTDGIEFFEGESLEETSLEALRLSFSQDAAEGYEPIDDGKFADLDKLVTAENYFFTSHHFDKKYRHGNNAIPGFNLLVLDIDGETTIETAQVLLKDYMYLIYTTKSHTDLKHRFRIILPLSHMVKLGVREHSEYMENVFEWLPFNCDPSTKDITRKWACNPAAEIFTNDAPLLDATLFIPQTKKSEQIKSEISEHTDLTHLESWFMRETKEGNRNQMLLKYGLVLKDARYDIEAIRLKIDEFNAKLENPISDQEISRSIMITIARRMGDND